MAKGNLRPVIYLQSSSGYLILLPQEVGHDESLARRMHKEKYPEWEWCEARTWSEVTQLQKRLEKQELDEAMRRRDVSMAAYDAAKSKTRAQLRQRMCSSSCSQWERDFILHWLELQEEKRDKYEQRFAEHHQYLWAIEQDANRKVEERMPSEEGDFWRNSAQQKA